MHRARMSRRGGGSTKRGVRPPVKPSGSAGSEASSVPVHSSGAWPKVESPRAEIGARALERDWKSLEASQGGIAAPNQRARLKSNIAQATQERFEGRLPL